MIDLDIQKIISDGGYYDEDNRWNAIIEHNGKLYRKRVEVLILDNHNRIYARIYKEDKTCRFPGGSVEKDLPNDIQASNECKEEANIIIKDITFTGIKYYKERPNFEKYPNITGSYNLVFISRYDKPYNGYVEKVDRDNDILYNSRFYDYSFLKEYMNPHVIEAYESFINNKDTTYDDMIIYPYYTPYQMKQLGVYEKDPSDNYYGVKASIDNSKWFEIYSNKETPGRNWKTKLFEMYKELQKDTNNLPLKQSIIEFGWNPEINPFNRKTLIRISESTKNMLHH